MKLEKQVYNNSWQQREEALFEIVQGIKNIPTEIMRQKVRAAMSIIIVQSKLEFSGYFTFPALQWQQITDIGDSEEEELVMEIQSGCHYEMKDDNELVF